MLRKYIRGSKRRIYLCLLTCYTIYVVMWTVSLYDKECALETKLQEPEIPWIYAITPTYTRHVQKAELTRLSHMIAHLHNFHWILIEDSVNKTTLVENFLKRSRLHYTHLSLINGRNVERHRGRAARNVGLKWLRDNQGLIEQPGVVYFMDDDNTYDLELFREMRKTQQVSVWPVGLVGARLYGAPICSNGKVTGWRAYNTGRGEVNFGTDMAGFAMNLELLWKYPHADFKEKTPLGYMEGHYLKQFTRRSKLEPFFNCSRILVWHTETKKPRLYEEAKLRFLYANGSYPKLEV